MKLKYKLTKGEQWIEDHMHEFVPVSPAEKRKIDMALASMRKKKTIKIQLYVNDLKKIKKKAEIEGLPYKTLILNVLHEYADDKLREAVAPYEKKKRK